MVLAYWKFESISLQRRDNKLSVPKRIVPRLPPLHGGRQRQIRGPVPSHGARVLEVRIHLPPAESRSELSVPERRTKPFCASREGGAWRHPGRHFRAALLC